MEAGQSTGFLRKLETAVFPVAAAVIGIGYIFAILKNNSLDKVLHSPHAIIFLLILLSIAFFPLHSVYKQLTGQTGDRRDSD